MIDRNATEAQEIARLENAIGALAAGVHCGDDDDEA